MPGLDGAYVGPSDLGLSLGHEPTRDPTAPEVVEAIGEIVTRTKAVGRLAGVHTGSPAMIRRAFAQGYVFASLLTDARMFTTAIAGQFASVHQTVEVEVEVKGY